MSTGFFDLSVADVARRIGMSEDRVRRLAASGALPGRRIGEHGHWRFSASEIDAALRGPTRIEAQAGPGIAT
jgi:excisionase family DNA binding protein